MLHSAELHVLQASTLTNDGVAKGAKGVLEGQTARALEQKIHPSSRDLLHPLAHRLTYNLPAKHGFNLALSRYRSARTSRRAPAVLAVFTFFLRCSGCQSTLSPPSLSLGRSLEIQAAARESRRRGRRGKK